MQQSILILVVSGDAESLTYKLLL